MVRLANCSRSKLHRVVLHAEPGGIEDQPEHLRVGPSGPAGERVEHTEDEDSVEKRVQEIEYSGRPL